MLRLGGPTNPVRYSDTVRRTVDVRPVHRAQRRTRAPQARLGGRPLLLTASVRWGWRRRPRRREAPRAEAPSTYRN